MSLSTFPLWTVYSHPKDFPDKFVARRFDIGDGRLVATEEHLTADTIDELRAKLPQGMHRLPRYRDDDPVIVEVWL